MEGRIKPETGQEQYAQFFIDAIGTSGRAIHLDMVRLFIQLVYGDPKIPRSIPAILAFKYWPEELEKVYLKGERESLIKHYAKHGVLIMGNDSKTITVFEAEVIAKHTEKEMQKIAKRYREGEFSVDLGVPAIKLKKGLDFWDKCYYMDKLGYVPEHETHVHVLPNVPPRVLSSSEIEKIGKVCHNELLKEDVRIGRNEIPILRLIDDLIEFCNLLTKPENHIKVPSRQYVEKPVYVRPVHDMTDEMVQELTNLPRFTAYAKVIAENEGEQTIWKGKIKTLPLPPWHNLTIQLEPPDAELSHKFCKTREQIEDEIRQRQKKWRDEISDEAPPTHG